MKLTAEEFLREKLESEISSFGDGTTEFHTRDIQHLLKCLDDKDEIIKQYATRNTELLNKIDFKSEAQFKDLLFLCMSINNLSAEERLNYIRKTYKDIWDITKNKK